MRVLSLSLHVWKLLEHIHERAWGFTRSFSAAFSVWDIITPEFTLVSSLHHPTKYARSCVCELMVWNVFVIKIQKREWIALSFHWFFRLVLLFCSLHFHYRLFLCFGLCFPGFCCFLMFALVFSLFFRSTYHTFGSISTVSSCMNARKCKTLFSCASRDNEPNPISRSTLSLVCLQSWSSLKW